MWRIYSAYRIVCSLCVLGTLDNRMEINEVSHLSHIIYKVYHKCTKDFNLRTSRNIEGKLHDIGRGNTFLDMTPKAKQQKKK